jgi:hypothetical protein
MVSSDFAVFILTHGRPDNVVTYKTLRSGGYTGPVYFIVDNEDAFVERYRINFGGDRVIVFDKKAEAERVDEGSNFDNRKVILHARNACFDIARGLGIRHFIQLDDDYYYFGFRFDIGAKKIVDLNKVFSSMVRFHADTNILSLAMSQGGDHIGGFAGIRMKRKCMNSFLCSTDRPFQFVGSINEDVNTYTTLGARGGIFFTFTGLQLDQKDTQSNAGGMTDQYQLSGTYVKSFHTVMMQPSSVRASMMNTTNKRIHHLIKWANTVPCIIDERHRKIEAQ